MPAVVQPDSFISGPGAPVRATARALAKVDNALALVLVEGISDQLALETADVEALFDAHGDLGPFRSLQSQPAWRGRELDAQMRRFLGSGARRKSRYARLLVEAALERDALPQPLDALLTAV